MIARIESVEVPASIRTNDMFRGFSYVAPSIQREENTRKYFDLLDTISNVCIVVLPRPTFHCSYYYCRTY